MRTINTLLEYCIMLTFDTHDLIKKLQKSNFTLDQAETITELLKETQQQAFEGVAQTLASKEDLTETKHYLEMKVEQTKTELNKNIEESKTLFHAEIGKAKTDMVKWMFGMWLTLLISQIGTTVAIILFFSK